MVSEAVEKAEYSRIEIFPMGGLVYITEDVFEKEPQFALKIVQLFFAKIEKLRQPAHPDSPCLEMADISLLWRLCVRPELMEYLFERCERDEEKLEAGDADAMRSVHLGITIACDYANLLYSRAELCMTLGQSDYIVQEDPDAPISTRPDELPILSERRIIAEDQLVDYFNTVAYSHEEANLRMIRYYASLQIDMRRNYRHLFVVHTETAAPCVQSWKQEIETITEVITPEEFIEELDKDGKASKFDFGTT